MECPKTENSMMCVEQTQKLQKKREALGVKRFMGDSAVTGAWRRHYCIWECGLVRSHKFDQAGPRGI